MSKVAVVFWSGTGNTEAMANAVVEGAKSAGAEVTLFEASEFSADAVAGFDAIAFGCPAMGDEELEDSEFEPMFTNVTPVLGDKPIALFGSYEWNEGAWMENWAERCSGDNLNVVKTLTAYDAPDDDAIAACEELGKALAK